MSQRIERLKATIKKANDITVIRAGEPKRRIRLIAMHASTTAVQSDFMFEDTEGEPLSCNNRMGSTDGGGRRMEQSMSYNPAGWFETEIGRGLAIRNTNNSDMEVMVTIAIV